jgi:hypothetical protein
MQMKKMILTLATAASLAGAGVAVGQTGYGEIDRRQAVLEQRIEQGADSGRLNREEVWRARRTLTAFERAEQRYMRDGYLSRYERADLDRRLDMLTNQIRSDWADNDGPRDEGRYGRYGYNTYRPPY